MARELVVELTRRFASQPTRAVATRKGSQELDARIERLKHHLWSGDPDLWGDELQSILDWAIATRRNTAQSRDPGARRSVKIRALPCARSAETHARRIEQGLQGDERTSLETTPGYC